VSYDERLNHVLRAATDVIADVGYEKASMRAVARAADVSLAGLYHYFDSKEKMLFLIQFPHELDSLTGEAYHETRRLRREYYDLTRGIVERILDAHAPQATLDRHVAIMSLFGTLNWLYRWYVPKPGCSPATVANQITTQFLHGVLGASGRTG